MRPENNVLRPTSTPPAPTVAIQPAAPTKEIATRVSSRAADTMAAPVQPVASDRSPLAGRMPVVAPRVDPKTGQTVFDRVLMGGIEEAKMLVDPAKGERLQVSLGFMGKGQGALYAMPIGPPKEGEVRVDTVKTGYSPGTENTFLFGTSPFGSTRQYTGYMAVGRVAELGPGTEKSGLKVGDLVASNYGHANTWNVPLAGDPWKHVAKLPENLDPKIASEVGVYVGQMGPICVNVAEVGARLLLERALETGNAADIEQLRSDTPLAGKKMVSYGAGPVGIMTALMLRHLGAEVAVTDRDPRRLEMAQSFGFTAFNNDPTVGIDALDWVKQNWGTVDVAVNCAAGGGAYAALESALSLPQADGRAVVINPTFHQGDVNGLALGNSYHHRGLRHYSLDTKVTDARAGEFAALAREAGPSAGADVQDRASKALLQAARKFASREAAENPAARSLQTPSAEQALAGKTVKVVGDGEEALLLALMSKRAGAADVAVYGMSAANARTAEANGIRVLNPDQRPAWNEVDPQKTDGWTGSDVAFHCGESYGTLEVAFDTLASQAFAIDLGRYEGLEKVQPFYGNKDYDDVTAQIGNRLPGRTLPMQAKVTADVIADPETAQLISEQIISHRIPVDRVQGDFFDPMMEGKGGKFLQVIFDHTGLS